MTVVKMRVEFTVNTRTVLVRDYNNKVRQGNKRSYLLNGRDNGQASSLERWGTDLSQRQSLVTAELEQPDETRNPPFYHSVMMCSLDSNAATFTMECGMINY